MSNSSIPMFCLQSSQICQILQYQCFACNHLKYVKFFNINVLPAKINSNMSKSSISMFFLLRSTQICQNLQYQCFTCKDQLKYDKFFNINVLPAKINSNITNSSIPMFCLQRSTQICQILQYQCFTSNRILQITSLLTGCFWIGGIGQNWLFVCCIQSVKTAKGDRRESPTVAHHGRDWLILWSSGSRLTSSHPLRWGLVYRLKRPFPSGMSRLRRSCGSPEKMALCHIRALVGRLL